MNARQRARESWWQRMQPILNKELGWFGLPVPPSAAQIIECAELPPEASEIVQRIVKRTRLRRGEKRDVARELCGHFADGIESGAEVSELIRLFGDEKAAAKLIRRGKLRNRGILWKSWVAMRWGALGVVGVFLCAYVIFAVRLAMSERVISRDYLAEFNAPALAVPVEERGWTILEGLDLKELQTTWKDEAGEVQDLLGAEPGTDSWWRAQEFLSTHEETLDAIRRAAAKPHMAFVVDQNKPHTGIAEESVLGVLVSTGPQIRRAVQLLQLDTRRATAERDSQRVIANIRAIDRLSRGVAEFPMLINGLVAIACNALLCSAVDDLLLRDAELFSNAELGELAHLISSVSPESILMNGLRGERAMFDDVVQRVYSDNGNGDGLAVPAAVSEFRRILNSPDSPPSSSVKITLFGPVAAMLMPTRMEAEKLADGAYNAIERRMAQPVSEWKDEPELIEIGRLSSDPVRRVTHGLVLDMLPQLASLAVIKEYGIQGRDATLVAIALELYRRTNGNWPSTLNELVPKFLPRVPPDRFSGGSINYRLVDGKPLLYSVGADLDDDGGREPAEAKNDYYPASLHFERWRESDSKRATPVDGDWILWPPHRD